MYKLMIVEDEPLIRTGLKHYFDWQALGVHTIVEAENGNMGITTALREQPDLIITDIRMPEMNGLDMIEQLRPQLPETIFIILTGFNDFEYAQRAIKLGNVHAFLLKPLEYDESLQVIQECISKLQLLRQDRLKHINLEGAQLVKLLLEEEHAQIDAAIISKLCKLNSSHYLFLPFVLAGIPSRERQAQSTRWLREHAETFIEEAAKHYLPTSSPHSIFTYSSKTKLYGIIILGISSSMDRFTLDSQHQTTLDQYLKTLSIEHQLALYFALGKSTTDPAQIHSLLRESDGMLYQRFFQPDQSFFYTILLTPASSPIKPSLIQLEDNDKKRIILCIESANATETLQLMQRLAQDIVSKQYGSSPDYWLAFLQELISVIIRFANKNHIHIEGVYSEKLLNLTFVEDFQTLEALFEWLGRWMNHLGLVYTEGLTNINQQDIIIFEHIKAFIRENIDQDITLQMVADRFFYNPSYLSRLFKRKLDKNYMRFVTEIRMEFAQECLKQPQYLVTDVCTMCGYKSYKHFVKIFRSITGMTPTEFRKLSGW